MMTVWEAILLRPGPVPCFLVCLPIGVEAWSSVKLARLFLLILHLPEALCWVGGGWQHFCLSLLQGGTATLALWGV